MTLPENPIRIALVGKSREARTFVGRDLQKRHNFHLIGLDDYLDHAARALYGLSRGKRIKWEHRIRLYDAWHKIDPDIWINYVVRQVEHSERHIVIPDVRYLNEIKKLEEIGVTFIRVTSPAQPVHYIKSLSMDTNPGAALTYEWFGVNDDAYIKAKYSINIENPSLGHRAIDKVIKNLT